jgi:hypothetical protein
MSRDFHVEGRYFADPLTAFTFASIQADRMDRPVEVQLNIPGRPMESVAHPSNFVRSHLVTQ